MKKKFLIAISVVLATSILAWIILFFSFPVSIIDGKTYNANRLKQLNKQRELSYNQLYILLHDEINKIIYYQYNLSIDDIYSNTNEIEKHIIYNGDILLLDKINEFSLLYLTKEELKILRNTIYAQYGYLFQSKELSEHFNRFIWYNPLYNNVDERLTEYDKHIIEIIRKIENEQIDIDIQSILEIFYAKSINIENTYFQLMNECNNKISFPFQNRKTYLLNEIFPAYINIIKYNNLYYNEFALNLLIEQYENIIIKIIEMKTNYIMEYMDYYSYYPEYGITEENFFDNYINQCIVANKIIDKINWSNVNISDVYFFNIPVIEIDDFYYSLVAINELQKSMKIISSRLIGNIKNILINGINYQTEIYTKNINDYVNWYFSFFTSIDRAGTNFIRWLGGGKNVNELYYTENFNRIMNKNANFDHIVEYDLYNQINIILNIYHEYLGLKNYFSVNFNQVTSDIILTSDFIDPYINDIVAYFDQVFETLDNGNDFYLQEYTVKDNSIIKTAKTSIKLLADVTFFGGILVDYLSLKTQQLLNRNELEQKIFDSMIENQLNKIAIINDPFNYLFDKLHIGSIIFVDNYFSVIKTYQHYGVYIGNRNVIHFAPYEGQEISMENGIIHETTLEKFLNGRSLQIDMNIENIFSENEIVKRARSRLNEKGYNLITNNCEHFARWCVTGNHVSYQIDNLPIKIDDTLLIVKENLDTFSKFFELFR